MKVVIIGSGNVAWHLAKICKEKSHSLLQIVNVHSKKITNHFDRFSVPYIFSIAEMSKEADLYIVAVKDSEIGQIQLPVFKDKQVLVHTSGTVSIELLSKYSNYYGCLYPLQSFTKGLELPFYEVPLLIESSNVRTKLVLEEFGHSLSGTVQYMGLDNRRILHLSAVLANNFSNHLFFLAQNFLAKKEIDATLIVPLMQQTIVKLKQSSAFENQTGPARRADHHTLALHEQLLHSDPELLAIYKLLSDSILYTYNPKEK